jgi:short-subunit dehydrogenase
MSYWNEKTCLITGGSAGLGRAIGRALAAQGAHVVLVARGKETLEATVAEIRADGHRATAIVGDVTCQADVDRIAADVRTNFNRLDLLCNSAGRSARAAILDTTPEDFQQLIDVNFLATVRMTRAFASGLVAARGHLINIGSLASKVAAPYLGPYPASKHTLAAYSQQLRLELGPHGLHVLLACPGPIARDDAGERYVAGSPGVPADAQRPGGGARVPSLSAELVASRILKACERRRLELVVPSRAKLLFALSQFSPSWGDWLLRKFIRS